jgi:hypothetical protein
MRKRETTVSRGLRNRKCKIENESFLYNDSGVPLTKLFEGSLPYVPGSYGQQGKWFENMIRSIYINISWRETYIHRLGLF